MRLGQKAACLYAIRLMLLPVRLPPTGAHGKFAIPYLQLPDLRHAACAVAPNVFSDTWTT